MNLTIIKAILRSFTIMICILLLSVLVSCFYDCELCEESDCAEQDEKSGEIRLNQNSFKFLPYGNSETRLLLEDSLGTRKELISKNGVIESNQRI